MLSRLALLPTHELYKSPSSDTYEKAKNDFVASALAQVSDKTPTGQWRALMDLFAKKAPGNAPELNAFKENRCDVSKDSLSVLQLDSALVYFKNFYFLLFNTDKTYLLTPPKKSALMNTILQGIAPSTCEPGKITLFEHGLHQNKKSASWLINELNKQRILLIQEVADQYNQQHTVSAAYSIHTMTHLLNIATQKKIGIESVSTVDDAYLSNHHKSNITTYFNAVLPQKLLEHEQNVIPNLAQHVLMEITDWLKEKKIKVPHWTNNALQLTNAQQTCFSHFIDSFFSQGALSEVSEYNENYNNEADNAPAEYFLLSKDAFHRGLQKLVRQKVIDEGLFIETNAASMCSESLKNVRWTSGLNPQECVHFVQSLNTLFSGKKRNHWVQFILNHHAIFLAYPALILNDLIQKPERWQHLPKSLQSNVHLVDLLIPQVVFFLRANNTLDAQNNLIDFLWAMVRTHEDYFKTLPLDILENKAILERLLIKDGFMLEWIIFNKKIDQEIKEFVTKRRIGVKLERPTDFWFQNTLPSTAGIYWEILHQWPAETDYLNHVSMVRNTTRLLCDVTISTSQLIQFAQNIKPDALDRINQTRIDNGLSPLPHCHSFLLKEFSEAFDFASWTSHEGFLSFKRTLTAPDLKNSPSHFLSKTYKKNLARQSLLNSNQWVLGFMAYQQKLPAYASPFKTWDDVLAQLKITLKAAWPMAHFSLKVFLWITAVTASAACLYHLAIFTQFMITHDAILIGVYFNLITLAFIGGTFGPIIKYAWPNLSFQKKIGAVAAVILMVIFPVLFWMIDNILCILILLLTLSSVCCRSYAYFTGTKINLFIKADELIERISMYMNIAADLAELPQLFSVSFKPWITRTLNTLSAPRETLATQIENSILRLLLRDEPAATQKGELLQILWAKIQTDVNESRGHLTIDSRLNYRYHLDGQKKSLSFLDVASTTRVDKVVFEAGAPDSRFSFFGLRGGRTSTIRQLTYEKRSLDEVLPQPN